MIEAPVERSTRQRGNGRVGRKAGGAPVPCSPLGTGGTSVSAYQPTKKPARVVGQNPHGVKSGPKAVKGVLLEPGTRIAASFGMTKTTGDRSDTVRSPHSSQRAGKPSTGRRGTVDTASRQEGDGKPFASVNTGVILDMQRKLYCWSRKDPNKELLR